MAWRDTRGNRRKLLLFATSVVMGVAALVAVGLLSRDFRTLVQGQARGLLGADLVLQSRTPPTPEMEALWGNLRVLERSMEVQFTSMARFPSVAGTRLVQVRAVEGGYPFYGKVESEPESGVERFRLGQGVLVEENLATQFGLKVGDPVRLGAADQPVVGVLKKVPGESMAFLALAPRILVPWQSVAGTGLTNRGSLVRYRLAFRVDAAVDVDAWVRSNGRALDRLKLGAETVRKRRESLGDAMDNLERFLGLAGFVSLLLGGVGVASAMHVQVQQKLPSAAILRCLGVPAWRVVGVYVLQAVGLGVVGVLMGVVFGVGIQRLVPWFFRESLPVDYAPGFYFGPVLKAGAMGLGVAVLFTLGPLLGLRRVSPLAVLRGGDSSGSGRDPLGWLVYGVVCGGLFLLAMAQAERRMHGVVFALSLGGVFGVLWLTAKGLMWVVRRVLRSWWPYTLRQGFANLHRPQNRTTVLLVSLGLGTFLILSQYWLQRNLQSELIPEQGAAGRPNAVLFDIQADQKDGVLAVLKEQRLPVLDAAPVVTMRLKSVKGRAVEELVKDRRSGRRVPGWILRREYRSTYRDHLTPSEKLVGGKWVGSVAEGTQPAPVSLEEGIARDMEVGIGDALEFDVQGVTVPAVVRSLRKVDWRRVQSNFFVVFPTGVLEQAPSFYIVATRVEGAEASARMQRAVVARYPNVSAVDLTLILRTVEGVVDKVSLVLRCMALFTVGTGLVVLAGAVLTGRYQRVRESVLLRTLGATRRQVLGILVAEYALLGALAGLTGAVLSGAAAWGLAFFVFKVKFVWLWGAVFGAVGWVTALTVGMGMLMSWGVTRHPPLAVLRAEG